MGLVVGFIMGVLSLLLLHIRALDEDKKEKQ